ncbi:MAG: hypothetical protein JWL65_2231 [Gammaproteobacteria bacterium]|nr:hypothetical protein [Gammaproteobacteria bacterium]
MAVFIHLKRSVVWFGAALAVLMGLLSVWFHRRLLHYDRLSLWDSDLVAFSKMAYQPGLMILAVGWVGVTIAGPSNQLLCGPLTREAPHLHNNVNFVPSNTIKHPSMKIMTLA